MDVEFEEFGEYKVLIVREKVDLYNTEEFKKILFSLTTGENTHVAVELKANTTEMYSSVIGVLIAAKKKMAVRKCSFVIINVSETIASLFALAGLKDFFVTVENINQLI